MTAGREPRRCRHSLDRACGGGLRADALGVSGHGIMTFTRRYIYADMAKVFFYGDWQSPVDDRAVAVLKIRSRPGTGSCAADGCAGLVCLRVVVALLTVFAAALTAVGRL